MKILIVLPVYNEEKIIAANLKKLGEFAAENLGAFEYKIIVADNNSTDLTSQIVRDLLPTIKNLEYFYLPQKGKGWAVLTVWQNKADNFDFFAFMDADLATDLEAFIPLIKALENGSDLAIGSRYLKESVIQRSLGRRIFSWAYQLFLKIVWQTKIKDFPAGFKAVTQKVVKEVVPLIQNKTWFFDSELLYLAEKRGYKIKEIPVKWREPRQGDNKSRVNPVKVSYLYFKEVFKLRFLR
ncbi:MAG: hypothetical protein A2Y82_00930 [Candidatus Buchananbacteria bacterium RBG_13_36_9]|uniref:Glycosyltransferase 2-like domain-containing protein n=1 Tax=Candidatus Buchananbacteria bacterium RBG_13_36_9 TaxID=1797530 RepID=A0A1G1XPE8_9BACT|nr:MAG: hypothetical protein A2Y82_00930 [Candidatus Buchananbacteria bacterium RBG_13_36_9]